MNIKQWTKEVNKSLNKLTKESPFFLVFNEYRYRSPKGYAEYDAVTLKMSKLRTNYQFDEVEVFEEDFTHKSSLVVLEQAYNRGFRPYWLSGELFDAFSNSEIPKKLHNIERIVPVGLIFLPIKLKNPDGAYVKWILFQHRLGEEKIKDVMLYNSIVTITTENKNTLSWLTVLDDGTQYAVNHPISIKDEQLELETTEQRIHINEILQYDGKNIETTTEEEFTGKVSKILIQFLLYIQLHKETILAYNQETDKAIGNKKRSKKEKLQPLIIGEGYKIKRELPQNQAEEESIGHRDSPVTHLRSGHWRVQPYGSRENPEYKTIWIEPMLINA
jgi:hypothetical protein